MLERVMRRFGISPQSLPQKPTVFEVLLGDLLERVKRAAPKWEGKDPQELVLAEMASLEVKRGFQAPEGRNVEGLFESIREYLKLLSGNQRLPLDGQLSVENLQLLRSFLLEYDTSGSSDAATRCVSLLEEKLNRGLFSQTELLLQFFDTTPDRRRSNERTLFYEEMISRFGSIRTTRISGHLCRRFQKALNSRDNVLAKFAGAAEWLAQHGGIHLNVLNRPNAELERWLSALEGFEDTEARKDVLDLLVPTSWRMASRLDNETLLETMGQHLHQEGLNAYTIRLFKAAYFVALVTGRTGFESLIKTFFGWVERNLGCRGSGVLPDIHKRSTLGGLGLTDALEIIRAELMEDAPQLLKRVHEGLEGGLCSFVDYLCETDPNEIPPGEYDLTGLVIDQATHLVHDTPSILFRVHRIC